MSVAFTKEDSAETAAETQLPDRPVPPGPNLVTQQGLAGLEQKLAEARAAYDQALTIEDVNERRRQAATPFRDVRYFAERVRTAQVVPAVRNSSVVAFGCTVTLEREDGHIQTFAIVGEDEADPKTGSLSFTAPLARELMGKGVGDIASVSGSEVEIVAIA